MYYDIKDFGAVKGKDCTKNIQDAVDAAFAQGGGTVFVPAGEYIIGTVQLKDNITLHLDNGALLKASANLEDFKLIGYVHNELGDVNSVIYAMNAKNIKISGEGSIDLNGNIYFDPSKPLIPEQFKDRITPEQITECTWYHKDRVKQPIFFLYCDNVKITDITVINSPTWTITFSESKNIKISGINIFNHPNVPNNDGIHFCSSSDIIVDNCNMDCADDCIAITCITNWEIPCENIIISNCKLKSYSKALDIGYMQSVVRNVTINNVNIQESNRGFCIMSSYGDGLVENVTVSNCIVDTKVRAGNWWGNGEPIFIMGTYHHAYSQEVHGRDWKTNVKNVKFSSVICSSENSICVIGENNNISGLLLKDISVKLKESKNIGLKGKIADLSPSQQVETIPQNDNDYYLVLRNVQNIVVDNVTAEDFKGKMPEKCIIGNNVILK